MKVYEIRTKVFTMKPLPSDSAQGQICKIIDSVLSKDEKWLAFHKKNQFKNYCFDSLYPIPRDKIYKAGGIYTFTVRTINEKLAKYFQKMLSNEYNNTIKCLTTEMRIIPKKFIETIYSITPVIIKDESGYWKQNLSLKDFERRLMENLIKKYNHINGTKIDENVELYTSLEFKNKKPCSINIKDIKLLGDKIALNISNDKMSQDLAYMALGTGILEINSRGAGFVNFKWM
ncbi:hypothetical protein TPELB_14820 [Terrisporobacter petrolearius]|uniref:CRISPR associated protein Cas6 C-terminal domain-containing protein n=1 Tax=Terrisporobacter petrolearius TaxID=1460447 RepID=A0ABZ3FBJ3_9FIRM